MAKFLDELHELYNKYPAESDAYESDFHDLAAELAEKTEECRCLEQELAKARELPTAHVVDRYINSILADKERLRLELAEAWKARGKWHEAALRLGESLDLVGPHDYYAMTPEEWLSWALDSLRKAREPYE